MSSNTINMNNEVWADVNGFEGIYQISNLGKVRSLDRKVHNYMKKGRILKQHDNGHSYLNVGLSKDGIKNKHVYVHILVAKAFIPNPQGYTQVNHKDFNKQNNSVENLEWVSPQQNILHYRHSKHYVKTAEKKANTAVTKFIKRSVKYKQEIINRYKNADSVDKISKDLNVGRDFVSNVLRVYEVLR